MTTLSLTLPEPVREFVQSQAEAGGVPTPDAYVQDLIQRAYQDQAKRRLNAELLEGLHELERGECAEMTPEEWAEIRKEVEDSFAENRE